MLCRSTVLVLVLLAALSRQTDAQFFTKANAKSIPRMGRSMSLLGQNQATAGQYRRALVDRLIDEYGPNLSELLQMRANEDKLKIGQSEFVNQNEQPIEANQAEAGSSRNSLESNDSNGADSIEASGESGMSREERSSPQGGHREASLAMRAFNTNRLLQALSSAQPLMSYDRIYLGMDRSPERRLESDVGKEVRAPKASFINDK